MGEGEPTGAIPTPPAVVAASDPRVFLAVERTFLAWVRTGLAMMGFGFVVARFGVFLREVSAAHPISPEQAPRLSLWFGTVLVVLGAGLNLMAALQYVQVVGRLNRGILAFERPSVMGITVACLLAALGLAMTVYLIGWGWWLE